MSLYFASLNSGSNGNCYYVGNDYDAVLIDAGISCRETQKRMEMLGIAAEKIKAIFISHEHTDHIKGAESLAKKLSVPIYITPATRLKCSGIISNLYARSFSANQPVTIGNLQITGFPKKHDADDPHSFVIHHQGINIGVFTDIGKPCDHVIKHFSICHAAFLESNYDESMLENGHYPIYLKNRIRGDEGHLSNTQALELFVKHKPAHMSHVLLSHLSKENNHPELVAQIFKQVAGKVEVVVASRYNATGLFYINSNATPVKQKKAAPVKTRQLHLFD